MSLASSWVEAGSPLSIVQITSSLAINFVSVSGVAMNLISIPPWVFRGRAQARSSRTFVSLRLM
jgi:hypothetical protein